MRFRLLHAIGVAGLAGSVSVLLAGVVYNFITGTADLGTYLSLVIPVGPLLILWYVYPSRAPREMRTAAVRALYHEAQHLITDMTPDEPYRVGNITLIRLPGPVRLRVVRLNRVEDIQPPDADGVGVVTCQAFMPSIPVPLVRYDTHGLQLVPGPAGRPILVDPVLSRGWLANLRGRFREVRLLRTGVNLASPEELRTLVEQLRAARPIDG